jgi:hypothetical protein
MAKKATKERRRKVDPFVEAAEKARAPVEDFRLWMLRSARGYSGKQWSAWENWWRPIPDKYVIAYMHEHAPGVSGLARSR